MNILVLFIILSIVNVVFSTIRSITTIKGGKTLASLISGGYFAFYNIMLIYTVADFPMWQKCLITFICNVIGVWVVKFAEEIMRKDKLWEIRATISPHYLEKLTHVLSRFDIPFSVIETTDKRYCIVNIYSASQKKSVIIKDILYICKAKYFVSETKAL